MEIADKVVVVTGAASGIGAGLARRFADEGAAGVVVADLDVAGAAAVAQQIGPGAIAVGCDVTSEEQIRSMIERARAEFGRVDIYISNAGIPPRPGGFDLPDSVWERMWQVNSMAHVWAARELMPEMTARGDGYFMITSSAAGVLNLVESAPYAATKHAAVAIAEWLRIAYGRSGVRVSCLCPQAVESGMTRGGAGSAGGDAMLTPAHVADTVIRAMRDETFLILSHPETATYMRRRVDDYDRWLGGMQKVHQAYWADRT